MPNEILLYQLCSLKSCVVGSRGREKSLLRRICLRMLYDKYSGQVWLCMCIYQEDWTVSAVSSTLLGLLVLISLHLSQISCLAMSSLSNSRACRTCYKYWGKPEQLRRTCTIFLFGANTFRATCNSSLCRHWIG